VVAFFVMNTYEPDIALNPVFPNSILPGGIQRVNFLPFIGAAIGGLATGVAGLAGGAISAGAGALGAIASGATSLAGTAIGTGGAVLGGIGELAGGIFQTGAGVVSSAGSVLFGGGAAEPGLTVGQSMAAMAEPGYYGVTEAAGGLFSNLSLDTLGNVASLGFGLYQSAEQRKLAEKAIEAQRRAGYVVGAPGAGTTALAPTTSVTIPAAAAAAKALDTKVMIKYAIYALIAYLLFKGFK